jgi:3-oxoadipate enol-lactonase
VTTEGDLELPDGGTLHYRRHGTAHGTPLLLLRPLGGSIALWGAFADRLAGCFSLVTFDPRGAGRSSAPPLRCSTRGMARDALALLDALGVEKTHVFGLSLGGMVAMRLAALAPERIVRLVLASTSASGSALSSRGVRRGMFLGACMRKKGPEVEACLARRILSSRFREEHPEEVKRIQRIVRREPASRAAVLALVLATAMHDARADLPAIAAPTLLLSGELDHLLPVAIQEEWVKLIPGASHQIVPGAGHDLSLEAPEETADRVAAFLLAGVH